MAKLNYLPVIDLPEESIKLLFLDRPFDGSVFMFGSYAYIVSKIDFIKITYSSVCKTISIQTDFALKRTKKDTDMFIKEHCFGNSTQFISALAIKPAFGQFLYFNFYYSVTLTLIN